ncbi:salicylate hydroxylase [Thelephora ganbajun]|uniref:Salicylate hydroxylase n=1 Tax=Thelephora ganbajun TaxID=370292 RepID=A0ACB6ZDD3_THEGA|nr:salicylate hydroxylase [Thelephora ganbajun]
MDSSLYSSSSPSTFKQLKVAVVGGGIGGLSAAVSLRRTGHIVMIFERRSFDVEVGASLSAAANGIQWLLEWGIDISIMRSVALDKFVAVKNCFIRGSVVRYVKIPADAVFYRKDMHQGLLHTAISEEGKGVPCKIVTDHRSYTGTVTFKNGRSVTADIIVGAGGIRLFQVCVRKEIGIIPCIQPAPRTCYRCHVSAEDVRRLGLAEYSLEPAIQFWGGFAGENGRSKYYKVVLTPCSDGDIVAFYCFLPSEETNHHTEAFEFKEVSPEEILQGSFKELDSGCVDFLKNSFERMPWRMYLHEPYEYWHKAKACLLGGAAHPMMPHQSQGACQAIEDAAALGIIFSDKYGFTNDVEAGLALYEKIRRERATRIQDASSRAMEDLNERIGFTNVDPNDPTAAGDKLTHNEMNEYKMHDQSLSRSALTVSLRRLKVVVRAPQTFCCLS